MTAPALAGTRDLRPEPADAGLYGLVPAGGTLVALACATPWLLQVAFPIAAVLLACFLAQCVHGALRAVLAGHQLLAAVFWTFSTCYLAIPALFQVSHNEAAWGDAYLYYDKARLVHTLVLLNLGYALFALGQAGRPARVPPAAEQPHRVAPRRLTVLVYVGLSTLLLPLVVSRTGGVGALVSSRNERVQRLAAAGVAQAESGGVMVALVAILPGALALASTFVLVLWWRDLDVRKPALLALGAALLFLYDNPFANTRFISTVAIFSIVFLLLQPRTRRGMVVVVTVVVVGVIGVYPVANAFRGDGAAAETLSLADNDFDGFQQLVNTTQYVEQRGHTWGAHLGSATLFFLPRRFWPGKAVPASIPVAENRGYTFTNLSLPLPGELYLDFGAGGMALAMFGWGRLWRRLDRRWAGGTGTRAGAMVPYLAIAQLGLLRGPVGSMIPIYGTTVVLLLVALREPQPEPTVASLEGAATQAGPSAPSRSGTAGAGVRRRATIAKYPSKPALTTIQATRPPYAPTTTAPPATSTRPTTAYTAPEA